MSVETITIHGVPVFGQGVQPHVGEPQQTVGNDLVQVVSWTAEYQGGQLQISAVVQPTNPADTIMSLIVAATPTTYPYTVFAGSDTVNYGGDSAGVSVAGMAFSGLWNPAANGNQVIASINGLVYSNGRSLGYGWVQTMTVQNA